MKDKTLVFLIAVTIVVCVFEHFGMISHSTGMYMLGIILGWNLDYAHHKERMHRFFEELDGSCDEHQDDECPNNNSTNEQ